ncbi:MAG: SagB/ThcOx family dehydrogenase [Bacteroidales bacterium]|nr:SagB/ThcOx family dehydrogenase [Bacteroidales bacterium]MDD3201282.1 SagB/ThcOx family dehydrogenase [Bacteroidales bacterium]
MKRLGLILFTIIITTILSAQDIQLPKPTRTGGMPLMEALDARKSDRAFSDKELSDQTLSDLLWAAWGFNREDKRTAPSSRNRQEIDVYVSLQKGLYLYDAKNNVLKQISKEDIRSTTGVIQQLFVKNAPVNLIYVSNKNKITGKSEEDLIAATYANTGFISQNVYLFCASEGLNTVVRAMFDKEKLAKKMNLGKDQIVTLTQTVGYPK